MNTNVYTVVKQGQCYRCHEDRNCVSKSELTDLSNIDSSFVPYYELTGTLCQTMFVTPKVIATFYPNLKLTILTLHFITISSVTSTI